MSRQASDNQGNLPRAQGDEWRGRYPAERREGGGPSLALLLGGLVAAGVVGYLIWGYVGPDVKRYVKIRDM